MQTRKINQPTSWSGKQLTGDWLVTLKIDGVRAIWHDGLGWMSRAEKPLHNIPPWTSGPRDCEIFVGTFHDTIRATRTKHSQPDTPLVLPEHLYGLDTLDTRLRFCTFSNPTADDIQSHLQRASTLGYEGLVLRQGDHWIKVKPEETHDVAITGYVEGRGKHLGRLGYVKTAKGSVGSGFTDIEREVLWAEAKADRLVGQVIEVRVMEITANGKFRHPSFVRTRPDKLVS